MNKENKYYIVLYAVLFIALVLSVRLDFTGPADSFVYQFLRRFDDFEWVNAYLSVVSEVFAPFNAVIIFLVVAFIYYFRKDVYYWLYMIGAGCSLAAGTAMKYIFQRARPDVGHASFEGFSFPSMHVLSFLVLVTLLFRISSNIYIRAVLVFLVFSMMVSRVYLGAHYLYDTVASVIIIVIILHVMEAIKIRFLS